MVHGIHRYGAILAFYGMSFEAHGNFEIQQYYKAFILRHKEYGCQGCRETLTWGSWDSEWNRVEWSPLCWVSWFNIQPFAHLNGGHWALEKEQDKTHFSPLGAQRLPLVSLCSLIKPFGLVLLPSSLRLFLFLLRAFKHIKLIILHLNEKGGNPPNMFWPNLFQHFGNLETKA